LIYEPYFYFFPRDLTLCLSGIENDRVENNEVLAAIDKEWLGKFPRLARHEELRVWVGQKGRETLEEHYSLKLWGPKVASLYKSLI
jgi:hypothetical protein